MLAELAACGSCVADRSCSVYAGVLMNLALILCSVLAAPVHHHMNDVATGKLANARVASQLFLCLSFCQETSLPRRSRR